MGLLGEWVKYNENFLFIPLIDDLTGQTRRWILTYDGSNYADSRIDVSFGFHLYGSLFRGQNPHFWGDLAFSSQTFEIENLHIIKTTTSIPTKFCTVIKTTKCPSWVVITHALQIQDGGRPPSWKNRKIVISQPRFARF